MHLFSRIFLYTAFCFCILSSFCGKEVFGITNFKNKVKSRQLPEFCLSTQGWKETDHKRYQQYVQKYGQTWIHMHHYCMALDSINASIIDKNNNTHYLKRALDDLNYVIERFAPDFPLKAMVLTTKGNVLVMLSDVVGAIQAYLTALQFDKKHIPAYIKASNLFIKLGEFEKASNLIDTGLKINPKSQKLQEYKKKYFKKE